MGGLELEFECQTSQTINCIFYFIPPGKGENQHITDNIDSGYSSSSSIENMKTSVTKRASSPPARRPEEEESRARAARRVTAAPPAAPRRASAPPVRSAAVAASLRIQEDATTPSRSLGLSRRGRSERRAGKEQVTSPGEQAAAAFYLDPPGPGPPALARRPWPTGPGPGPGPGPPAHRPKLLLRHSSAAPRANCPRPTLGHVTHGGRMPGLPGGGRRTLCRPPAAFPRPGNDRCTFPAPPGLLPASLHLRCTSWHAASRSTSCPTASSTFPSRNVEP
jgi:hypothetical protein